jgi:hypothetical protein
MADNSGSFKHQRVHSSSETRELAVIFQGQELSKISSKSAHNTKLSNPKLKFGSNSELAFRPEVGLVITTRWSS